MEARNRCSRDLFTSSGRATALIDRHFWYTFLQQSMTRLTNTAILLTYTSRFHKRFSGNSQEHICERIYLGRWAISRWVVTHWMSQYAEPALCRCGMYNGQSEAEVAGNILGWLALCSSSFTHPYSTVVFGITFWGKEGRMTVWL